MNASQLRLVAAVLVVLSATMVVWNIQRSSLKNVNTASRFATVESLVDYGTYAIDASRFVFTVDKVKIGDKYYSSKPLVLPTYTAGVYWIYQKVTGRTFRTHESQAVWFCTLWTGVLSHVLTLIYLFRFARRLFRIDFATLTVLIAGGFAYLGVGFATTLNNHTVAAAIVIAGFYHAHRARSDSPSRKRDWLLSGVLFGALPGIDIPCTALSGLAALYLLSKDWRRTLLLFLPAALPGLLAYFALTYSVTGSVLPVQIRPEVTRFAGSYQLRRGGIDALREPKHVYFFHMLLGHHGLLSMTPLFCFSLVALVQNLRRKSERFADALFLSAGMIVLTVYYTFFTRNYGGWSVGFRWLIPLMPALLLFFGLWLDRATMTWWKWPLLVGAFAVSGFHTEDALSGPFQFSRWHNWLEGAPNRNRTEEPRRDSPAPRRERPRRRRGAAP